MIPWVYLVDSPNIYDIFYHFKFGISFFTYRLCSRKCKKISECIVTYV